MWPAIEAEDGETCPHGTLLTFCGLVNDVRTRYVNRDPELLKLIQSIEATEKLVPEYLKKAA